MDLGQLVSGRQVTQHETGENMNRIAHRERSAKMVGTLVGLLLIATSWVPVDALQVDAHVQAGILGNIPEDMVSGAPTGEVGIEFTSPTGTDFAGSAFASYDLPRGVFAAAADGEGGGQTSGTAEGRVTYSEILTLLLPGFDGTATVGLGATLDGNTDGAAGEDPAFATAQVFFQIRGEPVGGGLGDEDSFSFEGNANSGIEQTIHETLSVTFPVLVTGGVGQFSIQISLSATAAAHAGFALSEFANTAVFDITLPPGATILSESGVLGSQQVTPVPEPSTLTLLAVGGAVGALKRQYRRRRAALPCPDRQPPSSSGT